MASRLKSAAGKLSQEIAETKECHPNPCTQEVDVVACVMGKPPTHMREQMEALGKMGKYHDGKENGTYQLQAGQCLFSLASAIAEAHKARRTTMPMINKLPFMGRLLGIQA